MKAFKSKSGVDGINQQHPVIKLQQTPSNPVMTDQHAADFVHELEMINESDEPEPIDQLKIDQ